jgi:thiamine biosynthesis lipoprotein
MPTVTLARNAMATRFEIVLHGDHETRLRGAGEAALGEIERLEGQLSIYRPGTELARVNAGAAQSPVRVSPSVFRLLQEAQRLHNETGGAFDIAVAPLLRCWGFIGGPGRIPDSAELERARAQSGMNHVHLDVSNHTVRFEIDGAMLDLGAIGKGYAIDKAVEVLREAGVENALVHGGTSTAYGLGHAPDGDAWKIALEPPPDASPEGSWIATVPLQNEALSVSAVWGRCFTEAGKALGHVIDPRTGNPVSRAVLAAVAMPSATESDALSTALLVWGAEGQQKIGELRPGIRTIVVGPRETGYLTKTEGISLQKREIVEKPDRSK